MNKADAVLTIIFECRRDKVSNTSAQKQVKACKAIGLEGEDLIRVLSYLDICDVKGEPFGNIKRTW